MLSLFVSLIFAFHRFPGERRSLARHRRNFNSIKSLQVLHDSDHGEYLFLPARRFAGRSRGSGNVSLSLIPRVYSLSTSFPSGSEGDRGWNDNWRSWELSHDAAWRLQSSMMPRLTRIWNVVAYARVPSKWLQNVYMRCPRKPDTLCRLSFK